MTDITIPPEALEAAAEAEYYARFGASAGPWKDAPDWIKHQCWHHARAALQAGIKAWPGMRLGKYRDVAGANDRNILPLPQENTNAEG